VDANFLATSNREIHDFLLAAEINCYSQMREKIVNQQLGIRIVDFGKIYETGTGCVSV